MTSALTLYWLPLGADGSPAVRLSGRVYEAFLARRDHRERQQLFHSALRVQIDGATFAVEMAPAWGTPQGDRGVVSAGAVGLSLLGRSRFFRYEIRRWLDGSIPDVDQAVDGPVDLDTGDEQARTLLALVPVCPTPVWGRDDLRAGEMWNSNSLVAWLLTRVGLDAHQLAPPRHGRAPGWSAGVQVAQRQRQRELSRF